jgi:hypothetical protein
MHGGARTYTHARLHVIRARPRRATVVLTFARPAARTSSVTTVKCRRSAGATDAGAGSRAGITRAGRTVQTLRGGNHRALLRERGARARLLRGRGHVHGAIASTIDQREERSSRRYAFASSSERYILLFLARKSVAHWVLSPFDCAVPTCSVFPHSSRIAYAKSLASPQRQWTLSSQVCGSCMQRHGCELNVLINVKRPDVCSTSARTRHAARFFCACSAAGPRRARCTARISASPAPRTASSCASVRAQRGACAGVVGAIGATGSATQ